MSVLTEVDKRQIVYVYKNVILNYGSHSSR